MSYVFSAFFFCLVFFLIYWYELFNLLSIWTVWYDSMIKQFRYSAFSMNKKMCLFLRNLFWANFVVNCNYFVYVMLLFLIYLETVFMSFEYSSNTCGSWICFSLLVFLYLIKCKLLHCAKCNLTNILLVVHILWPISRAFRWVK